MDKTIERRSLTQEEVDAILDEHDKRDDSSRMADLSNAELIGIRFKRDVLNVNFEGSSFKDCIFYKAVIESSFKYSKLIDVLFNSDITDTSFVEASLINCTYTGIFCTVCNFYKSKMYKTNFANCAIANCCFRLSKMDYVRFIDATSIIKCLFDNSLLHYVYFGITNIANSTFSGCDLSKTHGTELTAFYALSCPEEGSFIGFKKCGEYIVKLEICEDALRSSGASRKCRCNKAKVLSITTLGGEDAGITEVSSNHDCNFVYRVGEIVEVSDFDTDRWNICTTGIHFFITRNEAVNY